MIKKCELIVGTFDEISEYIENVLNIKEKEFNKDINNLTISGNYWLPYPNCNWVKYNKDKNLKGFNQVFYIECFKEPKHYIFKETKEDCIVSNEIKSFYVLIKDNKSDNNDLLEKNNE